MRIRLGERFGPVSVSVDEHVAKAYAFAQDDYGWLLRREVTPAATDGSAPLRGVVVPALVLANRLLRVYEERYERHANHGALHTRQELWFHQPVALGESVTITGRYVDAFERRGRTYLMLESTAAAADGAPVVTSLSTEAMPESATVEISGSAVPPAERAGHQPRGPLPPVVPSGDAPTPGNHELPLVVGAALPRLHKTLRADQLAVYSGAGDYQRNFHTDLEKAREAGFPRTVAQAMQTACHVGEWLAGLFGEGWATTGWQDSRFLAPVLAGECVSIGGRVTAIAPAKAGTRVALELWVVDRSSTTTAVGRAGGVALGRRPRVTP